MTYPPEVDPMMEALDLVMYRDGVATFEAPELPTVFGSARQTTVVVHMPLGDWHRLGRPSVLNIEYRVSVP